MSGLIACRAADTSIASAGPVVAAAALVAAWPVSITPTRDAVRPTAVTGRRFRHRRVPTTDASTRSSATFFLCRQHAAGVGGGRQAARTGPVGSPATGHAFPVGPVELVHESFMAFDASTV